MKMRPIQTNSNTPCSEWGYAKLLNRTGHIKEFYQKTLSAQGVSESDSVSPPGGRARFTGTAEIIGDE